MPQGTGFLIQKHYDGLTVTVDVMPKRDEALCLAMLYAESHHDKLYQAAERYLHIGAKVTPLGEHIGYQFATSNGTMVSYEVDESLPIRRH